MGVQRGFIGGEGDLESQEHVPKKQNTLVFIGVLLEVECQLVYKGTFRASTYLCVRYIEVSLEVDIGTSVSQLEREMGEVFFCIGVLLEVDIEMLHGQRERDKVFFSLLCMEWAQHDT